MDMKTLYYEKNKNQEVKRCKVVLLGDSGVGKSSILRRFIYDTFEHGLESTIGAAFQSKKLNDIYLEIWDTAGQERYDSLTRLYYRGADIAILVYDINKPETKIRLENFKRKLDSNVEIYLVANKIDKHPQVFSSEYTRDPYTFYVSAKDSIGIHELFNKITIDIKMNLEMKSSNIDNDRIKLLSSGNNQRTNCCSRT